VRDSWVSPCSTSRDESDVALGEARSWREGFSLAQGGALGGRVLLWPLLDYESQGMLCSELGWVL